MLELLQLICTLPEYNETDPKPYAQEWTRIGNELLTWERQVLTKTCRTVTDKAMGADELIALYVALIPVNNRELLKEALVKLNSAIQHAVDPMGEIANCYTHLGSILPYKISAEPAIARFLSLENMLREENDETKVQCVVEEIAVTQVLFDTEKEYGAGEMRKLKDLIDACKAFKQSLVYQLCQFEKNMQKYPGILKRYFADTCDFRIQPGLPKNACAEYNNTYIFAKDNSKLYYIRNGHVEEIKIDDLEQFKESLNKIMQSEESSRLTADQVSKLSTREGDHTLRVSTRPSEEIFMQLIDELLKGQFPFGDDSAEAVMVKKYLCQLDIYHTLIKRDTPQHRAAELELKMETHKKFISQHLDTALAKFLRYTNYFVGTYLVPVNRYIGLAPEHTFFSLASYFQPKAKPSPVIPAKAGTHP